MKRFIFATDLHGDRQNLAAVQVLKDFTKDFKPELRVFGGDLFDLRPLRRGASAEEQCETMQDDWNAGMDFIHSWKPSHFLMGNHDDRLFELAENATAGIKADYARKLCGELENQLRKLQCEWKPYHKRHGVLSFGQLKMLHGFHYGINAAKQHAQIYGSCLFGHIHAFDSCTFGAIDGRRTAHSSGALMNVDQEYNKRHTSTLRHENGFLYGAIFQDGSYVVNEAKEINETWWMPTSFRRYGMA